MLFRSRGAIPDRREYAEVGIVELISSRSRSGYRPGSVLASADRVGTRPKYDWNRLCLSLECIGAGSDQSADYLK